MSQSRRIATFARERRSIRRAWPLFCEVVREHDFRLLGRLALDVSPTGMLVHTDAKILTGEEVIVTFRMPRTGRFFDATGSIARVVHGRRPSDRGRAVGISFDVGDSELSDELRKNLMGIPPPIPSRPRRLEIPSLALC